VAPTKGTRLSQDWRPSEKGWEFAKAKLGGQAEVEFEKFQNYWLAKSGQNATKLDWDRTWHNWVLSARNASRATGRSNGNEGLIQYVLGSLDEKR
jgi:hypothetical protein